MSLVLGSVYVSYFKVIFSRLTLSIGAVLILAAGALTILPKYAQHKGLTKERDELLRLIGAKNHQIKALKEKQQRFRTDPEFVEQVGRENRRVRPDEYVFVFEADAE